jgi:peptidoglycan/LPS O-acetylase OafA/YrhL
MLPSDNTVSPAGTAGTDVPRAEEIDGIRGWSSMVVVLYHVFGEMLKPVIPALNQPVFAPFLASDLAVSVFFVLSGDALSVAYFHTGRHAAVDRLVVRRYFRLTVPILMSCLITYVIMKMGLDHHREAAAVLHCGEWLGAFLPFSPSLVDCVRYSLINVYVAHTRESSYNPLLWTMSIEMIGSMLVFLLCYLWLKLRRNELVCLVMVVSLTVLGSFFSLFVAGVLLGHWRHRGLLDRFLASRAHQFVVPWLILGGMMGYVFEGAPGSPHYVLRKLLVPSLAMMLVFCAYTQRGLKAFFRSAPSRFLGRISFPLYLIHFQVLISLMSWLVVHDVALQGGLDPRQLLGDGVIAVAASLVAAWCFGLTERYALKIVDRRVLRLLA